MLIEYAMRYQIYILTYDSYPKSSIHKIIEANNRNTSISGSLFLTKVTLLLPLKQLFSKRLWLNATK